MMKQKESDLQRLIAQNKEQRRCI